MDPQHSPRWRTRFRCETMAAAMSDRTNHRRVLHFAVTGMLLGGAAGCDGKEPAKDAKGEAKGEADAKAEAKPQPVPEPGFAPNPGPNERNGVQPEVAPTTAVKEPTPVEPVEPVEEDHVNEGPVEEPVVPPKPEKRVNPGPVKAPVKPQPIKVNPGPEG
jgi:hypothetical protein